LPYFGNPVDFCPILAISMADSSVSFEQFVKPTQSKMLRYKFVPHSKVLNLLNSLSIDLTQQALIKYQDLLIFTPSK
jgi:hypothetical protein